MPREAHGRPLQPVSRVNAPSKRRKTLSRGLNALEIAERENPDTVRIRRHRLGEVEDDPVEPKTPGDLDERSSKRRKITDEPEDEDEEGSDLDGNAWHEGVGSEDEDSEIDSEEAFGESDEERFEGFTFRSSEKHGNKNIGKNIQRAAVKSARKAIEDEQDPMSEQDDDLEIEEDDDLGDDAVDLATAWDMDDQDQAKEQRKSTKKAPQRDEQRSPEARFSGGSDLEVSEEEDDDEDEKSEEDGEEERSELSFSEDDNDGDLVKLQSFVDTLNPQPSAKRSAAPRPDWKSLASKPSPFGTGASKLTATDLLQYVTDPQQRQALKLLERNDRDGPESHKGGIPGKLAAPLAKRQQDKLDRAAAYEKSKETLGRWIDTVKQNRRAEHISFPLQDPGALSALSTKQFAPVQASEPMTALEATIQDIMQESGMQRKDAKTVDGEEREFEELEEKKLSPEEVLARRIELRKQRDLMFREEVRARRIKKIKSKAYRRVHRKERDKAEVKRRAELTDIGMLDSEEEREKNDRRRAEERMGARHRESKWAKAVKATGRAAWDEDARGGVADLARRDDELRRRVEGKEARGTDMSDALSESESDASNTDEENVRLEDRLNALQKSAASELPSKFGSMAFMQRAEAAKKAANDEALRDIKRSLRSGDAEDNSEDDAEAGRQHYGVSQNAPPTEPRSKVNKQSEFEERMSEDELEVADDFEGGLVLGEEPRAGVSKPAEPASRVYKAAATSRPSPKDSSTISSQVRAKVKQDKRSAQKLLSKATSTLDGQPEDYTSSSESEEDHAEPESHFERQARLANAIFAGPADVVEEFNREKKQAQEEDDDQVVDSSLPGWGSWTGAGVSKRNQKQAQGRFLTTIKGIAPEKRQDAKLDRVIVNEKRIRKNGKYLATELPHPFESRQQYERSLRLPLGPEWTTKTTFQDATKPRVLIKQGVIRPMAKPMV